MIIVGIIVMVTITTSWTIGTMSTIRISSDRQQHEDQDRNPRRSPASAAGDRQPDAGEAIMNTSAGRRIRMIMPTMGKRSGG